MGTMQLELGGSQKELRKTQQLLRQLERQLAKSHMSRKEAATASQQMQASMPYFCVYVMRASQQKIGINTHAAIHDRLLLTLLLLMLEQQDVSDEGMMCSRVIAPDMITRSPDYV